MSGALHIIFIGFLVVTLLASAMNLFGSMLYDLQQLKLQKKEQKHPHARRLRQRPLISVVIVNYSSMHLAQCLKQLAQNSYRKYEILLINYDNTKEFKKYVDELKAYQPHKKIKSINHPKRSLLKVITQETKGNLIFIIDSTSLVDKKALHVAVKQFALDPKIKAINARQQATTDYTISGLYREFAYSLAGQLQKFKTVIHQGKAQIFCTIYKCSFLQQSKQLDLKSHFSSQMIVYAGAQKFNYNLFERSRINSLLNKSCRLLIALAPSYFVYLAFAHNYPALLALTWLYFSFLLSFASFENEYLKFPEKLKMVTLSPLVSILFYFVNLRAIFVG